MLIVSDRCTSNSVRMTLRLLYTPCRRHCQVRSLTGAVHLQNNNGGVQRSAQCGQKPHVEYKDKSWLDLDIQYVSGRLTPGLTILLAFKEF
jgi:hypothetical protein